MVSESALLVNGHECCKRVIVDRKIILFYLSRGPALAVHEPDWQGRSRAQAAFALWHHDARRDRGAAGRRTRDADDAPLSVVPERALARGPRGEEGVGFH